MSEVAEVDKIWRGMQCTMVGGEGACDVVPYAANHDVCPDAHVGAVQLTSLRVEKRRMWRDACWYGALNASHT